MQVQLLLILTAHIPVRAACEKLNPCLCSYLTTASIVKKTLQVIQALHIQTQPNTQHLSLAQWSLCQ